MRVLILGGAGMLGHKLWQICRNRFETYVTLRSGVSSYARYDLFTPEATFGGIDANDFDSIVRAFGIVQPAVVINCIGIIKQLQAAKDPIISISGNSLFPHRLAQLCEASGSRLFHISTDCVFSGRKGMYREDDVSDAEDLYGRSKFLGEVDRTDCLTLRTSIIGRELGSSTGLVEWFLSQRGKRAQGYTRAIYSGLTTLVLGRLIVDLIEHHPQLAGLYHVSAEPITKFDLLGLLDAAFDAGVEIEPFSGVELDRSLDSSRFRAATGFVPPSWTEMVQEMAADTTPYDLWRISRES